MSLNQTGAQSKKPLGDGKKTEAPQTNYILYSLLVILIIIFIWKIAPRDSETMDIPGNKISVPHSLLDNRTAELNPNIEVEIQETGNPIAEAQTTSPKTDIYESGATVRKTPPSSYGNAIEEEHTSTASKNQNLRQDQYQNNTEDVSGSYNSDNYYTNGTYSYIYTGEVEMPQGTFRGLDQNGFARTNMTSSSVTSTSASYSRVNLTPIFEDRLPVSRTTRQQTSLASSNVVPKINKLVVEEVKAEEKNTYSSTGVAYGENAFPIKDTLSWHPYESLAYKTEEKEVFVAEKVRTMPTVDDLEPNIHPSTLGDRDTRMGFGVVIRPSK